VLEFRRTERSAFFRTLFETSCSHEFLLAWQEVHPPPESNPASEEEIFSAAGIPFIPAPLREKSELIRKAATETHLELIQPADIRAIIHSHSNWSDGSNTIEEMARACVDAGFEYLVISDHSKSAFYAKGLSEERIREQHRHIDELNSRMAPFRIFKSIECDILTDGTLDYADSILASFDLVITSIHSNLKMTEEKAMARLIRAITNPYTTILGHMTGRLLLSRPGYPVDHKTVIDCCAEHQVAIEINAHPRRLDLDWSWIDYALEKGVMLSINPDAHAIAGYQDIRFGVLAAQKGGLTKQSNLSSMSLSAFEAYLTRLKTAKNI
jgi:DNA polymerase (family 10)